MMRWSRADCSEVTPLEVWKLEFEGRPIWERLGALAAERRLQSGDDPCAIARSVAETALRFARRLRRGTYESMRVVRGFSALCLCGGLVRLPGFTDSIADVDEVFVLPRERDVLSGGHRVAESILGEMDVALVVDVGQTAIKSAAVASDGVVGSVRRVERPWDRLPVVSEADRGEATIDRAIEFIGCSINRALDATPRDPSALVLGLPCEVDEDLDVGRCSYGDWGHAPRFVCRLFEAIDSAWSDLPAVVVNDAELAAYGALDELKRRRGQADALVLTLGFGPGAAYVEPEVGDE